jgi:hypothetical protein
VKPLRIFLSYASEDYEHAQRLDSELSASQGFPMEIWFDRRSLHGGDRWKGVIRRAIQQADVFLLLLSRASTTKAGYVQREIREALEVLETLPEDDTYVIPLRLEECGMHFAFLDEIQRIDLFPSWTEGVGRLLTSLRARAGIDQSAQGRIRTTIHRIVEGADLGPYSFTPAFTVEGEIEEHRHRVHRLEGGLFTSSGPDPDWLFEVEAVRSGDDFDVRYTLALQEAFDVYSRQTSKASKICHLSVVPVELGYDAVTSFIDRSMRFGRLLDRPRCTHVSTEQGLDLSNLSFLWWEGKDPFWNFR